AILAVCQLRLLSFVLLGLFAVAYAVVPFTRQGWCFAAATAALVISLFLPFDVALGNCHFGSREGTSSGGPHFVRFIVGKPRHGRLIETYGEYITAGCSWPSLVPPEWILVWN